MKFMLTKYYFQKQNYMIQINELHILLDVMMMILLYQSE